jgi:Flp pilus assembly protein TadD
MRSNHAWRDVARVAAACLRDGTIKLRDLAGLSDAEMQALAGTAAALQKSGRRDDARAVYAMLLLYDPTNAEGWRRMADLHQAAGDHVVAVACYETAALLGGRELSATSREAHSLTRLGRRELADELLDLHQLEAERRRS